MIDIRKAGSQIAFTGFTHVEPIADRQTGPTCGFEAIENIIQIFRGSENDLTERDLLLRAQRYGFARQSPEGGYSLDIRGYLQILADYGIAGRWYPFGHLEVLIPALRANRGLLLVGDAHYLNSEAYHEGSLHAFILTNFYTDESGISIMGYMGIDSNFSGQQILWPYQNVETSALRAAESIGHPPVLVTDNAGTWPATAQFYRLLKTGQLVPVN